MVSVRDLFSAAIATSARYTPSIVVVAAAAAVVAWSFGGSDGGGRGSVRGGRVGARLQPPW